MRLNPNKWSTTLWREAWTTNAVPWRREFKACWAHSCPSCYAVFYRMSVWLEIWQYCEPFHGIQPPCWTYWCASRKHYPMKRFEGDAFSAFPWFNQNIPRSEAICTQSNEQMESPRGFPIKSRPFQMSASPMTSTVLESFEVKPCIYIGYSNDIMIACKETRFIGCGLG